MTPTGFFITFEGPEGAGKTSQVELLAKALSGQGFTVVTTREPGGTPLAEQIRDVLKHYDKPDPMLPETELLLVAAARAQHVRRVILPALAAGKVVLCDRFADSTEAYQGAGRALDMEFLRRLNAFAAGNRGPDMTILLDLPPEIGLARALVRGLAQGAVSGNDRLEAEQLDFHRRVREAYLAIARREPERVRVFDAAMGIAELHKAIAKVVADALR